MEPLIAIAAMLAAAAALGGAAHSIHQMREARAAELMLREMILHDPKLRGELLDELSKRRVGDRTLENLENRVMTLLLQMPKKHQPRVRAALKQRSRQGQRDYMFKIAADETAARRIVRHRRAGHGN